LRSVDNKRILPAKGSQAPNEQMPLVYSLSLTGKGCDIFSRVCRRISDCTVLVHEAAENLGRELSNDLVDQTYQKSGRKSVLLFLNSHELSCVPRRNCTIILKLFILQTRFALRYSATSTCYPPSPLFSYSTRIMLRSTHTSFHVSPAPLLRFLKANSRRRPSRLPCCLRQVEKNSIERLD
jgi:hypothetical protein